MIKFSKEVEKLYSEVINTDKLSNKILNLVSYINNNSFGGDNSTFSDILELIWDNQPLFTFEINYFHDCNKATYHNREDTEPISFIRSFFYWPLKDVNEEIVSFDDDFLSRKFFYPDIKMFLSL